MNPYRTGTKAAAHYQLHIGGGETKVIRMRLGTVMPPEEQDRKSSGTFGKNFDQAMTDRLREADSFYAAISPPSIGKDEALVMRQAMAGMLWTKQYYYFDLDKWLEEHGADPLIPSKSQHLRNRQWYHMVNDDVISMPDKWEYPWYAAWDLAFHCVALTAVDPDFAKQQLGLMLHDMYLHPNGQIPAYEWNFGDVNPPVHAWATWLVYQSDKELHGTGDIAFLKLAFSKLVLNFTWWVNRKDPGGRNVFEGGFLGLDNIGVFDRSATLPTGGYLEQADGTAWMALFSQNMLDIALELAGHDPLYEDMALKFLQHFLWIGAAMDRVGEHQDEMWDEEDGFFYDLLRLPDGTATRLKVRSMVGLLPLCASTVFDKEVAERFPSFLERARKFLRQHPDLGAKINPPGKLGVKDRRLLSIFDESKLRRVLSKLLDENEFLSPYGIRSLSKYHLDHPYTFNVHGEEYRVGYLPAESNTGMFGGNSNWRGPIWMPVNILIVRALLNLYAYYGNEFTVECPTGSGKQMNLFEVSQEISRRLGAIFLRNKEGVRPVYGGANTFQSDPHWRDQILFYEYFHGDSGAGLGASHQTGWTGVVGRLIQLFGAINADALLEAGRSGVTAQVLKLARAKPKPDGKP